LDFSHISVVKKKKIKSNPVLHPFINCDLYRTGTAQSPEGLARPKRQACEQMVTWPKQPRAELLNLFPFPKLYSQSDSAWPPSPKRAGGEVDRRAMTERA